jgi:hypothetical protein
VVRRYAIYQKRVLIIASDCEIKTPLPSASPLDGNLAPNSRGGNHFFQSAPNARNQRAFRRNHHFRHGIVGRKSRRIRD